MSVLLIDAGNTRIKWRYQPDSDSEVVLRGDYAHSEVSRLEWPDVAQVLVSSVQSSPGLHEQLLEQFGSRLIWLSEPRTDFQGFVHCYARPERLGIDRWLAMIGARRHATGDVLVIDAGTALTVDLLSRENHHQGGFIVPGLTLAQQSLWQNTERVLPYSDEADAGQLNPGTDTVQCVLAGIRRQQVSFIQNILNEYPAHDVFVTGGDGRWLAQAIGEEYWPELIFDGLDTLCAGYFLP